MQGKEFLISSLRTYFIVVTLITVSTLVLGLYLDPDARFGYEAFASPLIYGACGILPNVVMYTKRELTMKELLVRKAVQLVLIEGFVLFAAFWGTNIYAEQKGAVIGMSGSIFVIYVLVHVIDWLQNCMSARRITEELILFQKNNA